MSARCKSKISISAIDRRCVLALHDVNLYRQIATRIGVSKSAVQKIISYSVKYHNPLPQPRSGRPSTISPHTKKWIILLIRKHQFEPYSAIAARIGFVSTDAVSKVARVAGYCRCVALKKPQLKPRMIDQHMDWAEDNTGCDWDEVTWVDEMHIDTGEWPGQIMVTRKPDEAYLPECMISSFHSGRQSLMLWGCIANNKKGPLVWLQAVPHCISKSGRVTGGGINSEGYPTQVLAGPFHELWEALKEERGWDILLVEDGAPAHWGHAATIMRESLGIHSLTHPPNSQP